MTRKSVIGICAALLVTGVGFLGAESASAGWGSGNGYRSNAYRSQGYGNPGHGYQNYGHQSHGGYGNGGYSNWGGSYRGGRSVYRNTIHFDYQPPTINRHGGHFDTPRSGH